MTMHQCQIEATVMIRCILYYAVAIDSFVNQWDDDEIRFVLGQRAWFDLNSASSLKQQSTD
jgi:hypothetical protein